MNKTSLSLPFPVIGLNDDFKEGGFSISPSVYLNGEDLVIKEDDVEITNGYIKSLYDQGLIKCAYKIVCASTLFNLTVIYQESIVIPISQLANHIEIEVFLIAINDITNYHDKSFNDDYFLGENKGIFFIEKGSILGFGGRVSINLKSSFSKGAASIFSFLRSGDHPISIDLSNPRIGITYPYNEDQSLDITRVMPKKNKMVFMNLFIIPALDKAFDRIVEADKNNELEKLIEDCEWALILTETYSDYLNDDSYKSAQLYVKQLITKNNSVARIPVLEAFEELKN
jgi:hypothetical protein